jgi:hypothetical protein
MKYLKTFEEFDAERNNKEKGIKSVDEREFSDEKRKELASKGLAMPDGSFPIETPKDLENAIKAHGRATHPGTVKEFIMKRAKALGKESLIPDDWK